MSDLFTLNLIACIVSTVVTLISDDKKTIKINAILAIANGIMFGVGL